MALEKSSQPADKKPPFRKLRGYAFDPSLSIQLDTVQVNNIVYKVEWEDLYLYPAKEEAQQKKKEVQGQVAVQKSGPTVPVGEYIEIIDYDPATGVFYEPVDLNEPFLLAQDGLDPSVSNPQFHQQMVYAVIMTTIKNFEKALGRKVQWARRLMLDPKKPGKPTDSFVERLRVYPHALRQANAYYNPEKKALLFGYFQAQPAQPQLQLPGNTVFTCLSHDIIAHETTHAILDGLHRLYIHDTHPDTRAFHEAFADIVALFQHFTFPEVLKHQIAKTRGDLAAQNLLGQLAQEFGKGMGHYGSLRDAIGRTDPETGEWMPHKPNPTEYATQMEFHDRGAILVAAIFDAFLSIYRKRIKKYLRVATNGSGILAAGDLHPDMVELLANAAADTAATVLRICVRAVDYCPPVDVNFGDYLRALITADVDMVADDEHYYRVAFIEAFQKRGIYPAGIKSMSVESLAFEKYPSLGMSKEDEAIFTNFFRNYKESIAYKTDRMEIYEATKASIKGDAGLHALFRQKFIQSASGDIFSALTGMLFEPDEKKCKEIGLGFSTFSKTAKYTVEKLSLANRVSPDGKIVNHVIVTLTQKRGMVADINGDDEFSIKKYFNPDDLDKHPDGFIFSGGCTLIFDLDTMKLKYIISKGINDVKRIEQQYRHQTGQLSGEGAATYFDNSMLTALSGPFAFMHAYSHDH